MHCGKLAEGIGVTDYDEQWAGTADSNRPIIFKLNRIGTADSNRIEALQVPTAEFHNLGHLVASRDDDHRHICTTRSPAVTMYNGWSLADAGGDVEQRTQFAFEYSAVRMVVEEISQPLVDMVLNVKLRHFCSNFECCICQKFLRSPVI